MEKDFFNNFKNTSFTFSNKPIPIPADLRPDWRVALILLLLSNCCRGKKISLKKLHVLNWAVRTNESRCKFLQLITGTVSPDDVLVRYDPGLDRAVDVALGENLVDRVQGDKIQLTAKGHSAAKFFIGIPDFLSEEQEFMNTICRQLTEKRLMEMVDTVVKS